MGKTKTSKSIPPLLYRQDIPHVNRWVALLKDNVDICELYQEIFQYVERDPFKHKAPTQQQISQISARADNFLHVWTPEAKGL